jgi:hypothetical protein
MRTRSFIQEAIDRFTSNSRGRLPKVPDVIAGKHFGGFQGYESWVQECARACLENTRGIGADEISELTAIAMWQAPPVPIHSTIQRHSVAMTLLEQYAGRIGDMTGKGGLTDKVTEQIRLAQATRERGTLLVIALNPVEAERTGELKACVSAWNQAKLEEALAVPKQKYLQAD